MHKTKDVYGQYDVVITTDEAPFLNFTRMDDLLSDNKDYKYHTPRILWNETGVSAYSPGCVTALLGEDFSKNPYDITEQCSVKTFSNFSQCTSNYTSPVQLWLVDFSREDKMQFGRAFSLKNAPKYGEVVLSKKNHHLNAQVGDYILIKMSLTSMSVPLFSNMLANGDWNVTNNTGISDVLNIIYNECDTIVMPFKVSYIGDVSAGGKFSAQSSKYDVLINLPYFVYSYLPSMPPKILENINKIENMDGEDYAKYLNYSMNFNFDWDSLMSKETDSDSNDDDDNNLSEKEEHLITSMNFWNSRLYSFANYFYLNLGSSRISSYLHTDYGMFVAFLFVDTQY